MTNRTILIVLLGLMLGTTALRSQEPAPSALQQRAEAASAKNNIEQARSTYIRAYEDYFRKGQWQQGVECGTKATALYYKENSYQEAFDLLRAIDQSISAADVTDKAALHYYTTKERLQMYMKMRRGAYAQDQLNALERYASATKEERVHNDLLYTKAIYYYTFGMNDRGNAVFQEMVSKLTASKEYDKVEDGYKTLITNGRRSGSASLVAEAYGSYIAWKDSVSEIKHADEVAKQNQQIKAGEETIAERDSQLKSRSRVITGLGVLCAALAAVLVLGIIVLLRFVAVNLKQKKTIREANENNALKSQFISNISAQLEPTLKKLDASMPEVRALQDFTNHIQMLFQLEREAGQEPAEVQDIQLQPFCEEVAAPVRKLIPEGVSLKMDVPHMSAPLNREYTQHILQHLLHNAALHTPAGGIVHLECKKRGPHKLQFMVSNTGTPIAEEKREEVFKPFREVHDLTQGDGMGLPICRQMAYRMNGDLSIDPQFTRGTRFVLDLQI